MKYITTTCIHFPLPWRELLSPPKPTPNSGPVKYASWKRRRMNCSISSALTVSLCKAELQSLGQRNRWKPGSILAPGSVCQGTASCRNYNHITESPNRWGSAYFLVVTSRYKLVLTWLREELLQFLLWPLRGLEQTRKSEKVDEYLPAM